ncbi:MAG: alpha/beta hydrolase [Rhodobacteraceae bacterium]|nr:alpha/beta hydrolase [Paracoccaceae bacterium]
MTETFLTPGGRRIAFARTGGRAPGVIFLGGFRSDMTGTKALALEAWARAGGRAFLRFDYSGHGASSGRFEDGAIGDWLADARAMLGLAEGPQVLVGSSMGGWIALLLARSMPERVAGLVTVAAAPDFTEDIWAAMNREERARLAAEGAVAIPSAHAAEPHVITRRLIEEARDHLVLTAPLHLAVPVRFLQGEADTEVPVAVALRLLGHAGGPDIRLTIVKGADHRFSTPDCLRLLTATVEEVLARAA